MSVTGNCLSTAALKEYQGLCKFYRKGKKKKIVQRKNNQPGKKLWDGILVFPVRGAAEGVKGKRVQQGDGKKNYIRGQFQMLKVKEMLGRLEIIHDVLQIEEKWFA